MKKLFINSKEPFKAQIKNDIKEDDIFFKQYRQAAILFESLLSAQCGNVKIANALNDIKVYKDYSNNIIAFCGDRGYGKTSVMLSFLEHIRAISHGILKESCLFSNTSIVKETVIADIIYIDPSTLENEHNILDLLLSHMFNHMKEKMDCNNCFVPLEKRNKLIKNFQKVYRTVSIIKDSKYVLEKEFDDEGDLNKLSCLSESIRLKELFMQLLESYFSFMHNSEYVNNSKNNIIIIAIDDLDISFSNAYKMAEQIRKYLIIPGIVIFMAIKIPQLQLCIEEYNMSHFKMYMQLQDNALHVLEDIKQLSYKYISKLIPLAHRVLLSKISDIRDVRGYDGGKVFDNIVEYMNEVLYQKTGIRMLDSFEKHAIVKVDNLRDFVNMMHIIGSFDSPFEKPGIINVEVCLNNIEKYCNICFVSWLEEHLFKDSLYEKIIDLANFHERRDFHNEINKILYTIKQNIEERAGNKLDFISISPSFRMHDNSLCDCLGVANQILLSGNAADEEIRLIKGIKFLYSSRLSYLWRQMWLDKQNSLPFLRFSNRLIWGRTIDEYMGKTAVKSNQITRIRFIMRTQLIYNCLAKKMNLPDRFFLENNNQYVPTVASFASDDEKKRYMLSWFLFGMLCNNFYNTGNAFVINSWSSYISNNKILPEFVQVSVENYILYMCILDDLPRLLRFDLLGIENEYSEKIIASLKKYNRRNMECLGILICNPDHMEIMHTSISSRINYDYTNYEDAYIIKNFFEGMGDWLSNLELACWSKEQNNTLNISSFRYGDGEDDIIDISELYVELFELMKKSLQKFQIDSSCNPLIASEEVVELLEGKNLVAPYEVCEFMNKASTECTIETLKTNILAMAKDIGMYIFLSNDLDYLSKEWKDNMIQFFIALSGRNSSTGTSFASDELIKEYNSFAEHFNYNWLRMKINELKLKRNL